MRPIGKNIIVQIDTGQKNDYEIELAGGNKIWVDSDFGFNGRETNCVVAKVLYAPDYTTLSEGDNVLCHHNAFKRTVSNGYKYGYTGITKRENGRIYDVFRIEMSMVFCKIDDDGNALPLDGILIAERIQKDETPASKLLFIPDSAKKNYTNVFKIIKAYDGCPDVNDGDTVICYKNSDYEILYSYNYKLKNAIRIKYDDVLAISTHHEHTGKHLDVLPR